MGPDDLNQGQEQPKSYDDDLMADVMAAMSGGAGGDGAAGDAPADKGAEAAPAAADKPAEQTAEGQGKPRDEHGRFAAAKPKDDGQPQVDPAKAKPADQQQQQPPAGTEQQPSASAPSTIAPPPSWSVQSKSDWSKLPQHVRDDIAKREQEVSDGFARYQHLSPFDEMARRSGTTLHEALHKYTNLESMLRRDPEAGHLQVDQNLGMTQAEAAQLHARLAQRLGFQGFAQGAPHQNGHANGHTPPAANQNGADDPLLQVLQPIMAPVVQELNQLKSTLTQAQQRDQARLADSVSRIVSEFRADPQYRYYPNVEPTIERLLLTGMVERTGDFRTDLKTAYDMACRMSPEIQDALIKERAEAAEAERKAKEQEAADKARLASRSITGSAPGQAGVSARKRDGMSYEDDLEADVRAALQAAGGRV